MSAANGNNSFASPKNGINYVNPSLSANFIDSVKFLWPAPFLSFPAYLFYDEFF